MKNKKQRWRLVYLLPMAIGIYFKNQLKEKKPWAICSLAAVCLLVLCLIFVPLLRSGEKVPGEETVEASPSPSLAPSPSPTPDPVSLTLTFAGDCTLGMDDSFTYSTSFNAKFEEKGADYFLSNVRDYFSGDDLTVVNFEGTITDSTDVADKTWTFKGDKDYVNVLTTSSVEVCNLANNHTQDYGETGFSDTKAALSEAGLQYFGFEDTAIVEVNGVKVGFTGQFTVYEDESHLTELKENIQSLQDQGAQLIIANFHWGLEMDYYPDADQIELAHAAIDAGAHLVIGHHPHVLQGVEVYKGRYICYSLGNFCFGGNDSPPDYDCMMFRQTFTLLGDQVQTDDAIEFVPCTISTTTSYNDYCPTPAEGSEKERIMDKLQGLSADLGEKNIFEE